MIHLLALIPYPHLDPEIFGISHHGIHFGSAPEHDDFLAVRWYGVSYLTGFVLAYFVLLRLVRRGELRISREMLGDLVGWLALGVVAGGRTGYMLFYYKPEPGETPPWWEPFAIWHGGMAFHGGLAGVMLVLFAWSRIKKVSFLNLADGLALVTPIGL